MVLEVEVLEDNSDKEYERYKLKVVETVRENAITKPAKVGEVFTCHRLSCRWPGKGPGNSAWHQDDCCKSSYLRA